MIDEALERLQGRKIVYADKSCGMIDLTLDNGDIVTFVARTDDDVEPVLKVMGDET